MEEVILYHTILKRYFIIRKYILTGLCIPYSKTACLNASEESNLQLGVHSNLIDHKKALSNKRLPRKEWYCIFWD